MKTFTTFRLNEQLFGIEILYVREINKQLDITPVQHAPEYIRGLINLRGQIVTVLDINKRLNGQLTEITPLSCNVILRTDAEMAPIRQMQKRDDLISVADSVGLLIDDIDEIVSVDPEDIEMPPPNISERFGRYLEGVIKLEKELLTILSVPPLLEFDGKLSAVA